MHERPVVLAYDGSDHAAHAITAAAELLGARKAIVAAAFSPITAQAPLAGGVPVYLPEIEENLEKESRAAAERGAEVARNAGFEAEPRCVSESPPWRAIVALADDVDAAAIVVGARGLSGFKSALLGSTSNGVVHHTKRPVLVVHVPEAASDEG
jgi:nucleotide-binding universal stress UspA family protein